jgi:hypothetical protein
MCTVPKDSSKHKSQPSAIYIQEMVTELKKATEK